VPAGDAAVLAAISPDGRNLYVTNELSDDISQYRVGAGGLLAPLLPPTVAAGAAPVGIAVIPFVNRPPSYAGVTASPEATFPATRKLVTATLSGASDPDGDSVPFHIDGVTQDEPVSGTGIGDPTFPDARFTAAGAGANQVEVRAERNPGGDGRAYRIAFTVTDALGASCSGIATVSVPRHRSQPAVDSAPPSFDSFTGAPIP
jgi:hypothetical protein